MFQLVPNFSEGCSGATLEAIAAAIGDTPGIRLIDRSADRDHNRSVLTFLGTQEAAVAAALNAARVAVERIDMNRHAGAHPRLGALDVMPVVPLVGSNCEGAVATAEQIGEGLARLLELPVYFYEWNARAGRRHALPEIRRGGYEGLRDRELVGDRAPDLGPGRPHPTAGAVVVGARGPLVAYNVNLHTPNLAIARAIARAIRQERDRRPELEGVRALGLLLPSRNQAQVSLNLTRPDRTPLPAVFAFVAALAEEMGVREMESEIIGAIPAASLGGESPESIRWHDFREGQILDRWLPAV